MNASSGDTVFALASGAGVCGVAVIRISGPHCNSILLKMAGPLPVPRTAILKTLKHPYTDEKIDHALVLFFPGPESFTGEDVAEFHLHGGRAVIEACLGALDALDEVRMAMPGEFTRRAFENGKLDLTQVEGLADLIAAQTDAQRRQALHVASGAVGKKYTAWREMLIHSLAYLEADIDFVEEDDVPENLADQIVHVLEKLLGDISGYLEDPRKGEKLREGFRVVIAGIPNVGKSSLLNQLAMRDAAIVSDIAGTTRDVVEVYLDLSGLPVILSDTAGLQITDDEIELIGVTRTQKTISDADLVIWLADERGKWPPESNAKIDSDALWVTNKADLDVAVPHNAPNGQAGLKISAKNGDGLQELLEILAVKARDCLDAGGSALITRQRHREALSECCAFLAASVEELHKESYETELVAENLRMAARKLGRIVGTIDVEDLLDKVFSSFCVGK